MAGYFPDGSLPVQFNPTVAASIQDRTLQRVFRDSLFPRLLFRMEAQAELWATNLGTNTTFTRTGLIKPTTRPISAGADPTPKTYQIEQWEATAQQWADAIDTSMPTSYVTLASQYLRNMHQLGLHAGQSLNRVVRDKGYNAYVAGNTVNDVSASSAATTIHVANLVGFTRALFAGRPQLVSSTNPISISIPAISYVGVVTGFTPDTAGDEIHGGTLTISPALASNLAARQAVLSATRSQVLYSGGGQSVDDVSSSSNFAVRDIRAAIAQLRFNNVPAHEDGLYHCHLDPTSESQVFQDNEFQRLNQSMPDYVHYRRFALAIFAGVVFYRNNEVPSALTCDTDPTTGNTHGFEVTNGSSVPLHRPIFTGQGWIEEKYLDESRYISEAGVMGKIGEFAVTNGGVQVMTERIRLILRAPQDRLQQLTSSAWSFSGDWAMPTDLLGPGSPAAFKRSVVVVHGE
jgi:hypothetical protein